VLEDRGLSKRESIRTVETSRDHDVERLFRQREMAGDMQRMAEDNKQWIKELEDMFNEDLKEVVADRERS
tara:strand:+ start:16994 stop:17203 length:210 start_codon:yes stop_codon:yes gene_type:complete